MRNLLSVQISKVFYSTFNRGACPKLKISMDRKVNANLSKIVEQNSGGMSGGADIAAMRIIYQPVAPMDFENLTITDPIQLFENWFSLASSCDEIIEPNRMTVATATRDGIPSARVVLLKGLEDRGFRFFTNYDSRKGQQMAENPNVALVFYWTPLQKQVRVEGTVEKLASQDSDAYFHSRPHGSQIGACVSNQSRPIASRKVLEDRFDELKELYPNESHTVQRPGNWGGYHVRPNRMEFWQGMTNRLHSRVEFIRPSEGVETDGNLVHQGENGWLYRLLSP